MATQQQPAALATDAIITAIQGLPAELQTAFVTRREHEQQTDSISETMRELKSSIDELAKAVRQDTVPRRDYDDFVQQYRQDKRDADAKFTDLTNAINSSNTRTVNRFLGNTQQYMYWLVMILVGVMAFVLPHLGWH